MKCEIENLSLITEKKWLPVKGKNKKVFYASTSTKKGERNYFHNIVYPEFDQVDHINKDGLDNRRENLREGSGRVNANNKGIQKNNNTGITGVYHENHQTKDRYRAQWKDIYGNRKSKAFSIKKYGKTEALRLAIEIRTENHNKTLEYLNMKINKQ